MEPPVSDGRFGLIRQRPRARSSRLRGMNTASHAQPLEPATTRCPPATPDEIRRAEELRRQIHERYLANADRRSDPYWAIGAD